MADLYPPNYSSRMAYPQSQQQLNHSSSSNSSDDSHADQQPPSPAKSNADPPKTETKPQATFLTKLYALLERQENHHMIRWDPAGEHIIVERPEQLALHVLPSIYRQSRFASFSRQLNIYGFMRKVNLRNVDPAIDDPDASTWSHPTLNRHSPPEIVANFKRRVPPRLPKARKTHPPEAPSIPPPRTSIGMGGVPLSGPPGMGPQSHKMSGGPVGRARGFSAPGSFNPLSQGGAWSTNYQRSALPPLTVPDSSHLSHASMYTNSPHTLHPIPSAEDTSSTFPSMSNYNSSSRDMMSSQYSYQEQNSWSFNSNSANSNHNSSSLSSLLNPSSGGYSRPAPSINTTYGSPFSSMPMQGEHSASSLSPDSRPATGYSMSSVSSMPYADDHMHSDYSRPSSSHRPISPSRPHSSKSNYNALGVRRGRRHSQAMSPYPSPYDHSEQQRPSTSPRPVVDEHQSSGGIPRVRSMIQLPSVPDPYAFTPGQAEFAYSAIPGAVGATNSMDINDSWNHRNPRPSTSTSSISAASHTSSSQANTPPLTDNYGGTDINRYLHLSKVPT
ncbi:HSF-type DNA-binding-domain-containing protein [Ephemerocybe angulata]|uniref:HSF-type DNA-binding-domain-containing protein n=1 Tax=Ephemerocybe angulata TaxID=980116 RepID=A0A8H6IER6_9AGAR|nr:HSF-type DNA-binding-domain-containing protein [Tulosesus angulatus]